MKLIDAIFKEINDLCAEEVCVGIKYACVKVKDRFGLGYIPPWHYRPPRNAGELVGKKLANYVYSTNPIEFSIGGAAINAQLEPINYEKGDILDLIFQIYRKYERIGVIGNFPFASKLKTSRNKVYVFERIPMEGCLPDFLEEEFIPICDLVLISGATFINKTLQRLLELSTGYTIILGPSTPISEVLFEFGADIIAGVIARDRKVLDIVSQGGGAHNFKPWVENIYLSKSLIY
jgi:hypothetical protein